MSDELFPKFPGMTWDITSTPSWPANVVQRAANNSVTVLMRDMYPFWKYELVLEFLRDSKPERLGSPLNLKGYSEFQQLIGFHSARGGNFDSFLLDPGLLSGRPEDSEVHGGACGVGDGIATTFYLHRDVGGFLDEVQNPVAGFTVAVAGVPVPATPTSGPANWTTTGVGDVTFTTAPAAGAVITWDGRFRHRVRFSEESIDLKQFMYELAQCDSIKLEQVKL